MPQFIQDYGEVTWGQLEAAEWLLCPTPNGFPKSMSTGFIAQLHDFALGFPGARPSRCGPDEYAVPQLNSNVPCKCLWQVHGTMTSVSGLPQIDSGGLIVASPEAS